ncbi:uncharacterized protein LOC135462203 isoform X2 [Liolophura sinensis]|uniref:uncharacterized protein LOC135462203 isoform X2 n=1 Tax=Liolophura sinensis TaxID=3198878 RepID=UPI0031585087
MQDCSAGSLTSSNMEEMMDYFEEKGDKLDSLDISSITNYMENNFVSKVTFGGVPILPPMMTKKRREEMLMYKQQACNAETRLNSRKKEKITDKAQTSLKDTQSIICLQKSMSSSPVDDKVKSRQHMSTHQLSPECKVESGNKPFHGTVRNGPVEKSMVTRVKENVTVTEDMGTASSSQGDGFLTESAPGCLHLEDGSSGSGEPTVPSFLQSLSDYQSLEEMGLSLPTEYDGLPLTSTKQKQISQLLAKLSRELNIKDSLTSTSSSAHSEMGTGMYFNVTGDLTSDSSAVQHGDMDAHVELYYDALKKDTSHDTIAEVMASSVENLANESSSTIKSVMLGIVHDELSVDDKSTDSIRSPKSPKNTVHFASTVTEIYTDNKSGESSTLQKSLQSAGSTPRSSAAALSERPSSETLLEHLMARRKEMLSETNQQNVQDQAQEQNDDTNHDPREPESLLSKVVLSPELESSVSSSKDTLLASEGQHVPFQSYAAEGETSDKENECMATTETSSSPRQGKPMLSVAKESDIMKDHRFSQGKSSPLTIPKNLDCSKTSENYQGGSPVSRLDSNLSRVSLHSLTTSADTETIRERGSVESNMTGDSVSTIKSSMFLPGQTVESNISDHYIVGANSYQVPKMNIPATDLSTSKSDREQSSIQMKEGDSKKSHTRKGSYTLEQPSPALVRACSIQNMARDKSPESSTSRDSVGPHPAGDQTKTVTVTSMPSESDPPSQRINRKLDYSELDEERVDPVSQVELQAEREGKEEHLNRYLDSVRQQSNEMGKSDWRSMSSSGQPASGLSQVPPGMSDLLESCALSSLSSFTFDNSKINHMSQEELFDVQTSHFDIIRKKMVEQQKLQLEQLFQQQQREQLLLQREIEERCRLIGEQQEFLGDQGIGERKLPQSVDERRSVQLSRDPSLAQTSSSSYSYISSPSLTKHPSDKDNSIVSTFSRTTPKQSLFGNPSSPPQPSYQQPVSKPVLRSPRNAPRPRSNRRLVVPEKVSETGMKQCFDRVSAAVKGYLTRRLLRTEKVQNLIKTVRDTRDFALNFQSETPIKQGKFSMQDRDLLERIIAQLQAALLDIHEVFFEISPLERMAMISASRQLELERRFKELEQSVDRSHPRVSMATLKAIERKKRARAAEASVFGTSRPQSAPPPETSSPKQARSMDLRALRPIQGHISPIHPSQEEPRVRSNKDRPRTAPDRVTVVNTHRAAKGRKPSLTGAQAPEHRRPSKSLLVKAKPVSATSAANVAATKPSGKSKSGKAWR